MCRRCCTSRSRASSDSAHTRPATLGGNPVVDLWAGDADENGRPWQADTIVNVYSTTKTMAATVMLMLADRGEIDFTAPVAT